MTYAEFLAQKMKRATSPGITISPDDVHPLLHDWSWIAAHSRQRRIGSVSAAQNRQPERMIHIAAPRLSGLASITPHAPHCMRYGSVLMIPVALPGAVGSRIGSG